MDASLILRSNHGTMAEEEEQQQQQLGTSVSSSSGSFSSNSNGCCSSSSSSDDMDDDATSSASPSSPPAKKKERPHDGPLYDMSSLVAQLPFKRGLSKYYQGKSRTFTSLSNVMCLEDLAKPERPAVNKRRMKSCKSYGGGLDNHKSLCPKESSKTITKKASRGSLSNSLNGKKYSFISGRPPIPPHRSNFSSQTLLFA